MKTKASGRSLEILPVMRSQNKKFDENQKSIGEIIKAKGKIFGNKKLIIPIIV
jgi:hypothetical protein